MTAQDTKKIFQHLFLKFLNGESTVEEEDALSEMMRKDSHLQQYARELEKEWEHKYQSTISTNRAWIEASQQLHRVQKRNYSQNVKKWVAIAASLVIFVGLSAIVAFYNNAETPIKYYACSVPAGHQSKVVLPDSSVVWLNAKSTLRYDNTFGEHERMVELKGEGYFEVRHSDTKPFIVSTNNLKVQVMGTKFDVSAYPSDATHSVVLVSGSVKVGKSQVNSESFILKPGQRYQLAADGNVRVSDVDASRYVSWYTGRLVLTDLNMMELSQLLEKYYGIPVAADSSVLKLRYSGVVNLHSSLDTALSDLTKILPVRVEKIHGSYRISLRQS